jgi:hypothetical protein
MLAFQSREMFKKKTYLKMHDRISTDRTLTPKLTAAKLLKLSLLMRRPNGLHWRRDKPKLRRRCQNIPAF